MELEDFINDCDQQMADRERQRGDLFQTVFADVRRRLVAAIPQPLRQYGSYAGDRPTLAQLQSYPDGWQPALFKIEAQGLTRIDFEVAAATPASPFDVVKIQVGAVSYGTDWVAAVSAARIRISR